MLRQLNTKDGDHIRATDEQQTIAQTVNDYEVQNGDMMQEFIAARDGVDL